MTAATPPPALDARYGRSRGRRLRVRLVAVVGVALVVAAAIVWVAWTGLFAPAAQVDERDLGYTLTDDSATVRYEVSAPAGHPLSCAVEAQSESHVIIGWKVVDWGASEQRTRQFSTRVRASQEPVIGLISRCWLT